MDLIFTQGGEGELSKEKTYIALLRGVNVGGHRLILMEELQDMFKELGYVDPRTYVQSGNVVFGAKAGKGHGKKITAAIAKRFGHDVPTVVIEAEEFARRRRQPADRSCRCRKVVVVRGLLRRETGHARGGG
jgi:uncharacterized protein (DUF1697 family)